MTKKRKIIIASSQKAVEKAIEKLKDTGGTIYLKATEKKKEDAQ